MPNTSEQTSLNLKKDMLVVAAIAGGTIALLLILITAMAFGGNNLDNLPETGSVTQEYKKVVKATQTVNQNGASYQEGSRVAWIGTASDPNSSYLGLYFTNVNIPSEADIINARLVFTSSQTKWIAKNVNVYQEDDLSPGGFTSNSQPSSRNLSSYYIISNDNVNTTINSPINIKLSNQFVFDRNNVSIIIKGTGEAFARKFIYAKGQRKPKLVIKYSITTGTTNVPTATTVPTLVPTSTIAPTLPPTGNGNNSQAMGLWSPNPSYDTCTKEFHDSFSVIGPDGKRYPTWHPPTAVNPATGQTCTFGHEHGRNPQNSALYGFVKEFFSYNNTPSGGLPFGYANEKLDEYNQANGITNGMRHEDHVGHKIEWENNVRMSESTVNGGSGRRYLDVYCDFLMKVHQGTHSKDAFTNNMHELQYFVQCRDLQGNQIGTKMAAVNMVLFGRPGGFNEGSVAGGFTFINVGTAVPANSPQHDGIRSLPTINRVKESILINPNQPPHWSQFSLGLYEDWITSVHINRANGTEIAYFDPHFAVFSPSRFFWPGNDPNSYGITRTTQDKAENMGRSIDVCYMNENGERARGGECTDINPNAPRIPYDSPQSPFNGVKREFYFNQTTIVNANGPTIWYTDVFGRNLSSTPFTGSVKLYLASLDNRKRDEAGYISSNGRYYHFESNAIGGERYYGGNGVHAPN